MERLEVVLGVRRENDLNSVLFDLDYSQLTTEGSFRAVVMQMTYEIAQLLNLQDVDMGTLWRRCCSETFSASSTRV